MTIKCAARINHKLPLLVLATLAFLTLTLPRICALAMHVTAITADNSVLLANALGLRRNFVESITNPICFIKIYSIQSDSSLDDGVSYLYTVQGCPVDDFSRRFGVCKSGDCGVRPYQVQLFSPREDPSSAIVQNIWEL